MKNNRHGQAAILTNDEYSKIRKNIVDQKYKVLLDLAWYTGERWGALIQLAISDVYNEDGTVRPEITFKKRTRKASPNGRRQTRQVIVHSILSESLKAYTPQSPNEYLFPGKELDKHITLRWADLILRSAVEKAGLSAKGISTHSTRRTLITKLHRNGTDLYTIQKITGHKCFKTLARYVDISVDKVRGAIEAL